jgi:hypothetical protein
MKLKNYILNFLLLSEITLAMRSLEVLQRESSSVLQNDFFQKTKQEPENTFGKIDAKNFNELMNVLEKKEIESLSFFINLSFTKDQKSKIFGKIIKSAWPLKSQPLKNKFMFFYFLSNLLREESDGSFFQNCADKELGDFFKKNICSEAIDFFYRALRQLKENKTHEDTKRQLTELLEKTCGTRTPNIS